MMHAPFEDEKPLFHANQRSSGPSKPFVLSEHGHQVPYTINRYLRNYQREGIKFIYDRYMKSRGCILGDDMGLGKTIQAISFLAAVLQKTGTWEDVQNNRPEFLQSQGSSKQSKIKKVFLIVAPLSVLYNWKDELDTWGHFKTVIVHGVKKEEELARVSRGRCEIALTTYETLRLCLDQFNSIDWAAVIVDEAHKLKNYKSQITQAMKELKCKVRVGLTGTILQNNLEELWCVMDWAVPGCLGSLGRFKNKFSDPIEQGQKHSVTKRALAEGRKAVQTLAKRLSHWFLRRTKALISDQLPKKDDRVVYCSLTDFQQAVYRAVLDTDDVTLLLRSSEKCHCGSGRSRRKCCHKYNSDGVPVRHLYFSYLAILRKVANHVALLQTKDGTSKKQEKYVAAVCEQVFKKFPDFTERCKQAAFEAMSDPLYSGKMKVLQRLLNHFIKKKDKVLLFSLSTKLLDVLESYCMAEGLEYRRLDGTTKSKERVHIVKEFNSSKDINLCLVSTMAGGLGLNFVGANVVVLFDPTWNPANDLQAIDRAYRIGQCKDVTVFRLISLGTVEEIIYLRQIYKQQLQSSVIGRENARRYFEAVQGADGQAGELFGIRNLFRLQTDGTCLTHRVLEREGRVEAGIMTASTQATEDGMQEPVSSLNNITLCSNRCKQYCSNIICRSVFFVEVMLPYFCLQNHLTKVPKLLHMAVGNVAYICRNLSEFIRSYWAFLLFPPLLGNLQEVSYTHSNQKVVGSSRAENRLSRAAVRDVFELNKHSQLPANHLHDIAEVSTKDQTRADHRSHLHHQVTHSIRMSHHTRSATISVGETPATVRKQQLEEMVQFFGAKSVEEFAGELVRSSSAQRLSKLRKFYCHKGPELTDLIKQTFPKPKPEPTPPVSPLPPTSNVNRQRTTSKRTLLHSAQRPLQERREAEGERETVKKKKTSKAQSAVEPRYHPNGWTQLNAKDFFPSPGSSRSPSELPLRSSTDVQPNLSAGAVCNPSVVSSSLVRQSSKDQPSAESSSFSRADHAEPGCAQSNKTLVSDLIGDTSILDDLFKPKRGVDRPKAASAPLPSPIERTKNRGKDFWDILNEGNEDSINKLTDLSQVEKLCRSVSVSGRPKSEKLESSQLWKKNEKFIWKR
uniref:Excision repair cross-complementation group 6-like 2 n=1 Tax=Pygocentrus nattereri TaxID=42514 RepID=A0A3B4DRQ8_PYGNA